MFSCLFNERMSYLLREQFFLQLARKARQEFLNCPQGDINQSAPDWLLTLIYSCSRFHKLLTGDGKGCFNNNGWSLLRF